MSSITLTHEDINSGNPVTVKGARLTISGKKNNVSNPRANGDAMVEVQTQSYENFKYTLNGIHYTGASGILSWDDVITLYKVKYDGTNPITLNVTYGSSTILNGLSESTDITVVLDSLSLPIDQTDTRDGYMPIGSLTFVETA